MQKIFGPDVGPSEAVAQILDSVRREGDTALRRWTEILDQTQLESFIIPPEELQEANDGLAASLSEALKKAVGRIRAFHEC